MIRKIIDIIYNSSPLLFIRNGIAGKIDKRLDPVIGKIDQLQQQQSLILAQQKNLAGALQQVHHELDERHVRSIKMLQLAEWRIKQIMERQDSTAYINSIPTLLEDFSKIMRRLFDQELAIDPQYDAMILMELVQAYMFSGGIWRLKQEINELKSPSPAYKSRPLPSASNAGRLNILVVSGMFPAIEHGGGLRVFDILTGLSGEHNVDLYLAYDNELDQYSFNLLKDKLGDTWLIDNEQFADDEFVENDIKEWLQEIGKDDGYYDIIQLEYPHAIGLTQYMKQFGRKVGFTFMECMSKSHVIKIHDMATSNQLHDMASFAADFWKFTVAEKFAMDNADFLIGVTPEDAEFLKKLSLSDVHIVPTCLSDHEIINKVNDSGVNPEQGSVAFLGYYGHYPNIDSMKWYLSHIHPLVKEKVPDYRFVIIGAGDTSCLRDLVGSDESVVFTGRVDDIVPYIQQAEVCVLPLTTGAGIRGKLNQYSIAGRPSVSTDIGNKGLNYEHGQSVLLANDAAGFAEAVVSLLTDEQLNSTIGQNAKAHAQEHFTWEKHLAQLVRIYREQ